MRWDLLFHDLETQLEQQLLAEQADRRSEQLRFHHARLGLAERLGALLRQGLAGAARAAEQGASAAVLAVGLRGGLRIRLEPVAVGADWCAGVLQDAPGSRQAVLPFAAIADYGCEGVLLEVAEAIAEREAAGMIPDAAGSALAAPGLRIGLGFMLRDLCRRRVPVQLQLPAARLHGTIDRVGRDHLDLAVHPAGTLRRRQSVTGVRVVALDALELIELGPS